MTRPVHHLSCRDCWICNPTVKIGRLIQPLSLGSRPNLSYHFSMARSRAPPLLQLELTSLVSLLRWCRFSSATVAPPPLSSWLPLSARARSCVISCQHSASIFVFTMHVRGTYHCIVLHISILQSIINKLPKL